MLVGWVVDGLVIDCIENLNNSFALILVVESKFTTIWIISGLVEVLVHVNVLERTTTPLQAIVPEGALTWDGNVTIENPYIKSQSKRDL